MHRLFPRIETVAGDGVLQKSLGSQLLLALYPIIPKEYPGGSRILQSLHSSQKGEERSKEEHRPSLKEWLPEVIDDTSAHMPLATTALRGYTQWPGRQRNVFIQDEHVAN